MSNTRGFITTEYCGALEAERSDTGGIRARLGSSAWVGVTQESIAKTFRPACPRCGRDRMHPEQARNALSRKDNATYVCNSCGTDEAIANWAGGAEADVWPGYPDVATFLQVPPRTRPSH